MLIFYKRPFEEASCEHFVLSFFFILCIFLDNSSVIYIYWTMVLSKYRTAQKCISCIPCKQLIPITQMVQSFRKCFIVHYSSLFVSRFSIFSGIWPLNQYHRLHNLKKKLFICDLSYFRYLHRHLEALLSRPLSSLALN